MYLKIILTNKILLYKIIFSIKYFFKLTLRLIGNKSVMVFKRFIQMV
jgi:hypothetical protein